jgi:MFS family permease
MEAAGEGVRAASPGLSLPARLALIIGSFAVVMSATTLNIAIVPLMREYRLGSGTGQLFASLFLGATVLAAPLAAALIRRCSARSLFTGLLLAYVLASLAAAISQGLPGMLLGRVMQGFCAGLIQPLAMFLILESALPRHQGRAMASYSLGVVLAPALGPTLAGWSVEFLGWRSSFVLGVPPALLAIGLALAALPAGGRAERPPPAPFDWGGFGLLGLLVLLLVFWPLLPLSGVGVLLLGGLLLGGFWHLERGQPQALVSGSLFVGRGYRAAALIGAIYGAGMYGSTFLIPVFMQGALGFSALVSGHVQLLGGAALALSTLLGGRLVDRYSARQTMALGLASFALSCLVLAFARSLGWIAVAVVLSRVGLGLVIPGLYTGMARVVPEGGLRDGTAVISLLRQAFGALGVSLIGVWAASPSSAALATGLGLEVAGSAAAAPAVVFLLLALLFLLALALSGRLR